MNFDTAGSAEEIVRVGGKRTPKLGGWDLDGRYRRGRSSGPLCRHGNRLEASYASRIPAGMSRILCLRADRSGGREQKAADDERACDSTGSNVS
jgi:hypothetical protein